jgi:hypothetical protein
VRDERTGELAIARYQREVNRVVVVFGQLVVRRDRDQAFRLRKHAGIPQQHDALRFWQLDRLAQRIADRAPADVQLPSRVALGLPVIRDPRSVQPGHHRPTAITIGSAGRRSIGRADRLLRKSRASVSVCAPAIANATSPPSGRQLDERLGPPVPVNDLRLFTPHAAIVRADPATVALQLRMP